MVTFLYITLLISTIALVPIAIEIVSAPNIPQMIANYRIQSLMLMALTLVGAVQTVLSKWGSSADDGAFIGFLAALAIFAALVLLAVAANRGTAQWRHVLWLVVIVVALLIWLLLWRLGTAVALPPADFFGTLGLVLFAFLIPFMLYVMIEPLLADATISDGTSTRGSSGIWPRLQLACMYPFNRALRVRKEQVIKDAARIWLQQGLRPVGQVRAIGAIVLGIIVVLVPLAPVVICDFGGIASRNAATRSVNLCVARAFNPSAPDLANPGNVLSLVVALMLLLLGIFTMTFRKDLISQVIGLLVMDHGLYLAVVRGIIAPSLVSPLIAVFVVSLFLYMLITLVILVNLLPELHSRSESIDVEKQRLLAEPTGEEEVR